MIAIRKDDPAAAHVAPLLALHLEGLHSVMGTEFAFALDATGLSMPEVTFWTAWSGDTLAGFGALKQLAPDHGEVKSMRAAPETRGMGVGRAMIAHIIAEARRRDYRRLSLETGTADYHADAVRLYQRNGFIDCDAFADYAPSPHNRFMTLTL